MGNLVSREKVPSQFLDLWKHKKGKEEEERKEKAKNKGKGSFVSRFKGSKTVNPKTSGCPCHAQSHYMVPEGNNSQVSSTRRMKCSQWPKDIPSCCLSPQETQDQVEREQTYKCILLLEELADLIKGGGILCNEINSHQGNMSPTAKVLLDFWKRLFSQLNEDQSFQHILHFYHWELHSLLWVYGNCYD